MSYTPHLILSLSVRDKQLSTRKLEKFEHYYPEFLFLSLCIVHWPSYVGYLVIYKCYISSASAELWCAWPALCTSICIYSHLVCSALFISHLCNLGQCERHQVRKMEIRPDARLEKIMVQLCACAILNVIASAARKLVDLCSYAYFGVSWLLFPRLAL